MKKGIVSRYAVFNHSKSHALELTAKSLFIFIYLTLDNNDNNNVYINTPITIVMFVRQTGQVPPSAATR